MTPVPHTRFGANSRGKRSRLGTLALFGIAALVCAACVSVNRYYDPAKPHHTPDGFRNNYLQGQIGGNFWKWQWERYTEGLPKPPANEYRFPTAVPEVAWIRDNRSETAATWIGHATVLLQVNGLNILTDPVYSERASPFSFLGPKRHTPPGVRFEDLPRIDVVVISHNHYDHLDRETVQRLNAQAGGPPLFLVPLGLKEWMQSVGVTNARELDWWQNSVVNGVELHLVPVQHWSARSLNDRFKTLWGGWVVKAAKDGKSFLAFFGGDTGYSKDFQDIGKRFGEFDLALIPIGAYEPRWFMKNQHVDPGEAVRIHSDLRAKQSIAIHWGTFELTDEPLDEPPQALARELKQAGIPPEKFGVLKFGETRHWR